MCPLSDQLVPVIQPYHVGVYGAYGNPENPNTKPPYSHCVPPYVAESILPMDFFEFQVRSIRVGNKLALNPPPAGLLLRLKELKAAHKIAVVQIWFWDNVGRAVKPNVEQFTAEAKSRIDAALQPVNGESIVEYADIIVLAEENPATPDRLDLLKRLYSYVKGKYSGVQVYQYLSGMQVGDPMSWESLAGYADGFFFTVYGGRKEDFQRDWYIPDLPHPIIFHVDASDDSAPWSLRKWRSLNETVEFALAHDIAIAWYTRAWWRDLQQEDPIYAILWDALIEKSKEIQARRFLPDTTKYHDLIEATCCREVEREVTTLGLPTRKETTKVLFSSEEAFGTRDLSSQELERKGWKVVRYANVGWGVQWEVKSRVLEMDLVASGCRFLFLPELPTKPTNFYFQAQVQYVVPGTTDFGLAFDYVEDSGTSKKRVKWVMLSPSRGAIQRECAEFTETSSRRLKPPRSASLLPCSNQEMEEGRFYTLEVMYTAGTLKVFFDGMLRFIEEGFAVEKGRFGFTGVNGKVLLRDIEIGEIV